MTKWTYITLTYGAKFNFVKTILIRSHAIPAYVPFSSTIKRKSAIILQQDCSWRHGYSRLQLSLNVIGVQSLPKGTLCFAAFFVMAVSAVIPFPFLFAPSSFVLSYPYYNRINWRSGLRNPNSLLLHEFGENWVLKNVSSENGNSLWTQSQRILNRSGSVVFLLTEILRKAAFLLQCNR